MKIDMLIDGHMENIYPLFFFKVSKTYVWFGKGSSYNTKQKSATSDQLKIYNLVSSL